MKLTISMLVCILHTNIVMCDSEVSKNINSSGLNSDQENINPRTESKNDLYLNDTSENEPSLAPNYNEDITLKTTNLGSNYFFGNHTTGNSTNLASNFFFGNHTGLKKIHREKVIYYAIPWTTREKFYAFNDVHNRIIKAIDCYDYQKTKAEVSIEAGGIGFSFVTLLFKSAPSYGLEYAVEIFA